MKGRRRLAYVFGSLLLALALLLGMVAGCGGPATPPAPEKIKLGLTISISGDFAFGAETEQLRAFEYWFEEVEQKGGIFVPKYEKRIPIEVIMYDDQSEPSKTVQFAEKLMLEGEVDWLLPSWVVCWGSLP